ncbi:MAG: class I SAM-dependent methyltransferase [Bdellovibrionota bacterium]
MALAEEYSRQFHWRDWKTAFDLCGIKPGQRILDLGCGSGEVAFALAERGAEVVAVDGNEELLNLARKKFGHKVDFRLHDLKELPKDLGQFDGIWSSFTAAYFPEFQLVLKGWLPQLKKSGWICLVEMDDLLAHSPLSPEFRSRIHNYYAEALEEKKYDFLMGRKLEPLLSESGFSVRTAELSDQELSSAKIVPEVYAAWENRLKRMPGLKQFFGIWFPEFEREFLGSLKSAEHQSKTKVICAVGTRS